MDKKTVIPNMSNSYRPLLLPDKLGYPTSVGDEEWNTNLSKLYEKVEGGWVRKAENE